jgi:hypothetical protein
VPSDFNGDTVSDLAISAIVNPGSRPGSVNVLYGSHFGIGTAGAQLWSLDTSGVPGASQNGDFFGNALASGDFNGDGRADLAIGAPGYAISARLGGVGNDGAVLVLYGSFAGLSARGSQLWTLLSPGIAGTPQQTDFFGSVLTAGDFNGDGRDDLAASAGQQTSVTAVNVIYGSSSGLTSANNQQWTRDSPGIPGKQVSSDGFGDALAAGDFNGDLRDDLAVGVVYDDSTGPSSAGAVNVIYGSPFGLISAGNQLWTQNSAGIYGIAEEDDFFGGSVATGDFNGDGKADLLVGDSFEDIAGSSGCCQGAVNVIYGSASGLKAVGNQLFAQDSTGVPGVADDNSYFGTALATGDFNLDGRDDAAIGVPLDVINGKVTGSVVVLKGSASGLKTAGSQLWTQDSANVPGVAEDGDFFGGALTAGDFSGTGRYGLAIGVPHESFGGLNQVGAVNVLNADLSGLTGAGSQMWTRDSAGVPGVPHTEDVFGWALR